MVKRVICLVVLMVFAGAVATALWAEEPRKTDPKPGQPVVKEGDRPQVELRREGEGNREAAAPRLPELAARMDKVVVLTDVQKQNIVELNKVREAAIREIDAKYQADVAVLMTPAQKAKWDAAAKEGERRVEGDRPREAAREIPNPKPQGDRK